MSGQKIKNKSHLLEFYGTECDHCVDMEPLMQRVKNELGIPIRRFEVWYNEDNLKLLQTLDRHGGCGGVPFFYNKKTRGWICGATDWDNFKAWALGTGHESTRPPPPKPEGEAGRGGSGARASGGTGSASNNLPGSKGGYSQELYQGDQGIIGKAMDWLRNMQKEGMDRMQQRTEKSAGAAASGSKNDSTNAEKAEKPHRERNLAERGAFIIPKTEIQWTAAAQRPFMIHPAVQLKGGEWIR